MIKQLKIDTRILHGQVALMWCGVLDVDAILVANDEVVNNELMKLGMKMAKPSHVGIAIRTVENGIALLNNPASHKNKIMIIVKNSDDALKIAESVKGIESCNIGGMRNIGQEDGKMITAQICFTPKDIENVKKIQDFGIEIDTRTDPADTKRKFNSLI